MQFQFRYALLTYAQCGDLDPFEVVNKLSDLGGECIIGREAHSDGGTHLHAFVDFGQKYRSRDPKVFDVGGFHPNVSPSKGRPGEGYDYAIKDGDVVAGGLDRPSGARLHATRIEWDQAMEASSMDEFLESCLRMDAGQALRMWTNLQAYARWRYRPVREPYVHPGEVVIHSSRVPALDEWVERFVGPTQMGGKYLPGVFSRTW